MPTHIPQRERRGGADSRHLQPGAGMEAMFTAFDAAGRVSDGPKLHAQIGVIAAQAGVVFGG